MKHNIMHYFGIVIFFLASLVLFGQHATPNELLFQNPQKDNFGQSMKFWYLFENRDMGESSSHSMVRDDGWQTKSLPNDHLRTVFSRNGNFFAQVTLNPRSSTEPIDRKLTITVFSSKKESLYILRRPHLYDRSLPQLVLSDKNGSLILGENDTGRLWFYDNQGSVIEDISVFPEASYDLERFLKIEINEDGSRIAVLASKRGSAPAGSGAINTDGDPFLILFDSKGTEIWRTELPYFGSSSMNISPDGLKILVNNYTVGKEGEITRKSLVFDERGESIFETDLLYKYAHFSKNSNRLILADNQIIRLIDLESKKLKWQNKISRNNGIIAQVTTTKFAHISAVLLGKNDWYGEYFAYYHPKILIFDGEGRMVQEIGFDDQRFRTPALWISPDGDQLKVGFEETFYRYSSN
jgi:hypothetical protein